MIQTKIFSVLEIAKKTDALRAGYKQQAVENILAEISKDPTNINDAYVILDFIKNVSETVLEQITEQTVANVLNTGDNEALGIELIIEKKRDFHFDQDKEWNDLQQRINLLTDARNKRQLTVQEIVKNQLSKGEPASVPFDIKHIIVPNPVN